MVPAQVCEHDCIEIHAGNPPLRQRMGGNLNGRVLGAGVAKCSKPSLQGQRVGRGHAVTCAHGLETRAERADVAARFADARKALAQQPRDRRLAVGTGYADNAYRFGRRMEIAIGDAAEMIGETGDGNERDTGSARPLTRRRRIIGDGRCSGRDHLIEVIEAVASLSAAGKEQFARLDLATITRDTGNYRRRCLGDTLQQICKRHRIWQLFGRHIHRLMACIIVFGSRAGSASGGIASNRSDSAITVAKTGAATSLP